jgi:hypothetical protein
MQKERPNRVIRTYVRSKQSADWAHQQAAAVFYDLYDIFRRFLFAPLPDRQQKPLPQAVIAIQDLRVDTLAAYRLVPNAVGLPWEISLNAKYLARPVWEQAESLLHETIHLYQEDGANAGRSRFAGELFKPCKGGYHNQQFVELGEEVGLHPILGIGAHWRPADGQFERLMDRLGYEKPAYARGEFARPEGPVTGGRTAAWWFAADRGRAKGSSSLIKYEADTCLKPLRCVLRAGVKDLAVACLREQCGGVFRPVR